MQICESQIGLYIWDGVSNRKNVDKSSVLKVAKLATPPRVVCGLNCLKCLDRTDISETKRGKRVKYIPFGMPTSQTCEGIRGFGKT